MASASSGALHVDAGEGADDAEEALNMEKASMDRYCRNVTKEMVPSNLAWTQAHDLLGECTSARNRIVRMKSHEGMSRGDDYVYGGQIDGTDIRVYQHHSMTQPTMLFRPVVNPVLTVASTDTSGGLIKLTLINMGGDVVFESKQPRCDKFIVADLKHLAYKSLCATGFMTQSAEIKLIETDNNSVLLNGHRVLIKGEGPSRKRPALQERREEERQMKHKRLEEQEQRRQDRQTHSSAAEQDLLHRQQ